ncbi:SsgA family sporulation/cell division regulator [Streptomyces sp. YKOK-I1]
MTRPPLALQGESAEPAAAPPPSETAVYISLDQPMGACLLTHDQRELAVPVSLRCTSDDPLAVRLVFPACAALDGEEVTWVVARALLEQGLDGPADGGSVRVRPHGPVHTTLELRASEGAALIRFETSAIRRFLLRWATVGERVAPPAEASPVATVSTIAAQRASRRPPAAQRSWAI